MSNGKPTPSRQRRQQLKVSPIVRASKKRLSQDESFSRWKQSVWNESVNWISSVAKFILMPSKPCCRRFKSRKTHLPLLPGKRSGSYHQPFLMTIRKAQISPLYQYEI